MKFEPRTAPLPRGIDYPFAEQTAKGVALFDRFPEFKISDCRVHVSGPWFGDMAANGHFTHGITSVEAMPRFSEGAAEASITNIPYSQKVQLLCDPIWFDSAKHLAAELEKQNPNDDRIPVLRALADKHRMIAEHKEAFLSLGRYYWEHGGRNKDAHHQGIKYPMIDIECTEGAWERNRTCFGWLYMGMIEAAAKDGAKLVPVTYGQGTFDIYCANATKRDPKTGLPEYLRPERDFAAKVDPTVEICNQTGGVFLDGRLPPGNVGLRAVLQAQCRRLVGRRRRQARLQ